MVLAIIISHIWKISLIVILKFEILYFNKYVLIKRVVKVLLIQKLINFYLIQVKIKYIINKSKFNDIIVINKNNYISN